MKLNLINYLVLAFWFTFDIERYTCYEAKKNETGDKQSAYQFAKRFGGDFFVKDLPKNEK